MGCVYLITSPSGKQYVGQTTGTVEARWRGHVWDAANEVNGCRALHAAIRKHGTDAMCIEVLHETDDLDELNRLESHEIAQRGTLTPGGYNLRTGGDNSRLSDETRTRMSEVWKKRHADPELREKRQRAFADPELRQRLSESSRKTWADPAYRLRQSEKMRACLADPAYRQRHKAAVKAALENPDVRKLLSDASKAAWDDPARRKRHSERMEFLWADAAHRERRSSAVKAGINAQHPNVFCDGHVYASLSEAARALEVTVQTVPNRIKSSNPRFRWWHTIPNHNDPLHDGFEECAAIIEWAKANPDHENVPDWARPYLDHVPPMTPGEHGKAPSWAA